MRSLYPSLGLLILAAAAAAQTAPSPGAVPGPAGTAPVPVNLAFAYRAGEKFRILSEVDEEVYVNRRLARRAEIFNRIAFEVAEVAPDGSSGLLRGEFATSEREKGSTTYLMSEEYESEFRRDRLGRYEIDPRYYMPVVRNVPVLPGRPLLPGDSWNAPGEERHDLRRNFGIPDPYAIPFVARYRYEGPVTRGGVAMELITCSYTVFHQPGPPRAYREVFPTQIAGFSDQRIFWDPRLGQPAAYEERFKLVFDWSDGTVIEYRGTAKADILEAELMDRGALEAEVQAAIEGLEGLSVAASPEGVTISLDDVLFQPDSARLLPGELDKLARVAEILARHPSRDILVAGHTALAGSAEGRKALSEERARAVAERLVALGARPPERIQVAGYGAERPRADNATEAGRRLNRRVEIVILEN